MTATQSLPFELTDKSLTEWLEAISNTSPVNAGSQLNHAINQLRKADFENASLFPLLIKLSPATLHLANALATQLKSGPQSNKTAKIAKLSLQLVRNLALAFHSLSEANHLPISQILEGTYFALQLIGHYLRLSNLFHELPSETLWRKSGELFAYARDNNGLQQKFAIKIPEFRYQSSIEQVLKRNLIFTITAFNHQVTIDNQVLFDFANEHADLLAFAAQKSEQCNFVWNIKKDIPQWIQQYDRPLQSSEIALDVSKVVLQLHSNSLVKAIGQPELERVSRLLTGYEQLIQDTLPTAPIVFTMLLGLNEVYDFLKKQEKLQRIQRLSAQIPEQKQPTNFALEPLDHEKSVLSGYAKPQDSINFASSPDIGHQVKLIQSKNKNHIHVESRNVIWPIGDLVLMFNKKNAYLAGKILQTKPIANSQSTMVLIEKIAGTLTTQTVHSDQYPLSTAILIDHADANVNPEILLNYAKYQNGAEIQLDSYTVRLDSLVDYSRYFARYKFSSVSN